MTICKSPVARVQWSKIDAHTVIQCYGMLYLLFNATELFLMDFVLAANKEKIKSDIMSNFIFLY